MQASASERMHVFGSTKKPEDQETPASRPPHSWLTAAGVDYALRSSSSSSLMSAASSSSSSSSLEGLAHREGDSSMPEGADGVIKGWMLAAVRPCAGSSVDDLQAQVPVADDAWRLCLARLDALNLNLYDGQTHLWLRCDVYDAGRSVASIHSRVLSFTFADGLGRRHRVFCKLKNEEACHRWIEAIYQARAYRATWTMTSCRTAETTLCCCAFGRNVLSQIFWFTVGNFLAVLLDLSNIAWDLLARGGAQANKNESRRLELEANMVCNGITVLGLLGLLSVLYGTKHPMETVLRRARLLCLLLAGVSGAMILASLVCFVEDKDADIIVHVLRKRLLSVVDVVIMVTWINGAYLCTRALMVLKQDITKLSLHFV